MPDADASAPIAPGPRVLLIGLTAEAMRAGRMPGLQQQSYRERVLAAREAVQAAGFTTQLCAIDADPAAAAGSVRAAVEAHGPFAAAVVGSGLRLDPDYGVVLGEVVAALTELSPGTRICFPGVPEESTAAVHRAVRLHRARTRAAA